MGYIQIELAGELSRLSGRAISAEMIQHWEANRRPVPETVRRAYATLIANTLYRELGRIVGVTLSIHSPWRIHCWRECATCGHWFEIRSARQKFCGCGRRANGH
jgi:hypothetical protein